MGAAPAVSVVLPTYERREWALRAARSVLAQRLRDLELLVIDDGSSDGTYDAVRELDPRVHAVRQANSGAAAARNAALRLARAPIVAFLDADDRWLPDHLEVVTGMLERSPRAVLACTTPRFRLGSRQPVSRAETVDAFPAAVATLGLVGYTSSIAVRKEALDDVGGFDERLAVAEDHHLWLRLAARGPFCLLRRLTHVRQATRGSLIERGIRHGIYPAAFERIAEAGLAEARRLRKPRLVVRAEAACRYARALAALAANDDDEAQAALAEACAGLPELDDLPDLVAHRIVRLGAGRTARRRCLASAASVWPNPRSDTAIFLRVAAAASALRAARPGEAARLASRLPVAAAGRFAVGGSPLLVALARDGLRLARHRATETAPPTLPAGPSPARS